MLDFHFNRRLFRLVEGGRPWRCGRQAEAEPSHQESAPCHGRQQQVDDRFDHK